jgi:hypothetical protein
MGDDVGLLPEAVVTVRVGTELLVRVDALDGSQVGLVARSLGVVSVEKGPLLGMNHLNRPPGGYCRRKGNSTPHRK